MPKYRVKWRETVEYSTVIWAADEYVALETFHSLPFEELHSEDYFEEDYHRRMEEDTIRVEKADE